MATPQKKENQQQIKAHSEFKKCLIVSFELKKRVMKIEYRMNSSLLCFSFQKKNLPFLVPNQVYAIDKLHCCLSVVLLLTAVCTSIGMIFVAMLFAV